jgi:hypothetical protein
MQFKKWKSDVDMICMKLYAIDTNDMGFGDEQLRRFQQQGDTPQELSDYFGAKHNLTLVEEVMFRV